MKSISKPLEILRIISKCLKDYDENLKNKKIMFIIENKDKSITKEEVFFPKSSFYHLTGIILENKDGKKVNAYEFYDLIKNKRISLNDYIIKSKDKTTDLKLQVLPQLMRLDKMANMIGDFSNFNLFLQTEKIAGNINACMGFIKSNDLNIYIPNTALKKDIRDITDNRNKIIAIMKKDLTENLYKNITYLKQNYNIEDILKNKEINKNIDIENIYSADKNTDKKIYNFFFEEIEENNDEEEDEL